MLTPYFELSQTETAINLMIKAPLANVANTELTVDNDITILFYSSPYYLRINLPGCVKEIEGSPVKYDCDSGEFRFQLRKRTPGEYFEDLDMIGKLLLPRNQVQLKPSIQVLGEADSTSSSDSDSEEVEDWLIHSADVPVETNISDLGGGTYGFANKLSGLDWVTHTREEFDDILDIQDIDHSSSKQRARARKSEENKRFTDEHYIADFLEPDKYFLPILLYVPPWHNKKPTDVVLTQDEKEELKKLGNRDYLLDRYELRTVLLSLIDIIFAYAYNHRITKGENTVVSAWTINKLSATLSWFQSYEDVKDAKVTCARRCLIYPLYRNWELMTTVFNDTADILHLGRRQILKCMLEIHSLFNNSEPRYLLNRLYITDYCIWLQKCSDRLIQKLAESFSKVNINKSDVKLDINELEAAAISVCEEEGETDLLLKNIIHSSFSRGLRISNESEEKNKSFKVFSEPDSSSSSGVTHYPTVHYDGEPDVSDLSDATNSSLIQDFSSSSSDESSEFSDED